MIGLPTSIWDEVKRLQQLVDTQEIVRHWLEPTKRAPRVFSGDVEEGWSECLMRITSVGNVVPVVQSDELCQALWGNKGEEMTDKLLLKHHISYCLTS